MLTRTLRTIPRIPQTCTQAGQEAQTTMAHIGLFLSQDLCDQHLLAGHCECTCIPLAVVRGRFDLRGQPADCKLGEGHVRFFFSRLLFLQRHYVALHHECRMPGTRFSCAQPLARRSAV